MSYGKVRRFREFGLCFCFWLFLFLFYVREVNANSDLINRGLGEDGDAEGKSRVQGERKAGLC